MIVQFFYSFLHLIRTNNNIGTLSFGKSIHIFDININEIVINEDRECCGAHEVCERDNLQIKDIKIEYFEDEELDELCGLSPEKFTDKQNEALAYVLYSLKESEIAPWLRSLQLRGIQLPSSLREQALMIVGERRDKIG